MSNRNLRDTALEQYAAASRLGDLSRISGTSDHEIQRPPENSAIIKLSKQLDDLCLHLRRYRDCWEWHIACLTNRFEVKDRWSVAGTLPEMLCHIECLICDLRLDVADAAVEPRGWSDVSRVLNEIWTGLADLRFSRRLNLARRLPFRRQRLNIDRLLEEVMAIQTSLDSLGHKHEGGEGRLACGAAAEVWPGKSGNLHGPIHVDVIVPVYRGIAETLDCLWSVLQAKVETAYELIVVDDCGPEAELAAKLAELARCGRFTLLRNSRNLGFVQSVNRGMAEHVHRDVVLLNSDTLVHDGWLDRLSEAAQGKRVGTVTPLSNTAGIFSYPRVNLHNPLPADADSNVLNDLAARVNAGAVFTAPTAVGFCMYIKRECLCEVGMFDTANFGLGYGEENDFCMRATKKGWIHLGCPSAFVYHAANVSFGPTFRSRVRHAYHTLKRLHPEYPRLVKTHLRLDPGREYRCRLDIQRQIVANQSRPAVLHILTQSAGSQRRHVNMLCESLWQQGVASLIAVPDSATGTRMVLINPRIEETPNAVFDLDQGWDALVTALRASYVYHLHYHDVFGWNKKVRRLPVDLNCSYDLTLAEVIGTHGEIEIRTDFDESSFFRGARRLIVSTALQSQQVGRIFPRQTCLVRTCGTAPSARRLPAPAHEPVIPRRVLILPDMHYASAMNHWTAALSDACSDAGRRRLPLQFFMGGSADLHRLRTGKACTILDPWSPRHWNQYLALARPHLVLPVPASLASADEMLGFCVKNAVMPVAFDDNVAANRLRTLQWGDVLPVSCTAVTINDVLLKLTPMPPPLQRNFPGSMLFEQYMGMNDYYDGLVFPG